MAITRVSVTSGRDYSGGSGGSIAASAQAHTTGNALIVGIRGANGGTYSLADTAGNTGWRRIGRSAGFSATQIELWVKKNITGHATNVVTASFTSLATFRSIIVAEYSGLATDIILDQVPSILGERTVVSTTITSPAFTTEHPEELVIGLVSADQVSPNAWSPGSGYTEFQDDGTFMMMEKIVSSILTGDTASATYTTTVAYDMLVGTFLPPLDGSGSPGSPGGSPGGGFETGFATVGG